VPNYSSRKSAGTETLRAALNAARTLVTWTAHGQPSMRARAQLLGMHRRMLAELRLALNPRQARAEHHTTAHPSPMGIGAAAQPRRAAGTAW
jgi:hypothetical protein